MKPDNRASCVLDGCDRPPLPGKSGLCKRCYWRLWHQMQRGPTWIMERQHVLRTWTSGVNLLIKTKRRKK